MALEHFDLDFRPGVDCRRARKLSGLAFVELASAVGKTRLAAALGVKSVEANDAVLILTLATPMTGLVRACHES